MLYSTESLLAGLVVAILLFKLLQTYHASWQRQASLGGQPATIESNNQIIHHIQKLAKEDETAEIMNSLIIHDGAGSWPPRADHSYKDWPAPLQPYATIYIDLAEKLAIANASLVDDTNVTRISQFRSLFREQLSEKVNMSEVKHLLEAVQMGDLNIIPGDVYNAFYCCVALCRHAYRWGTIPVVKVAQMEKVVDLPAELNEPWVYLQRHYGCNSQSGNNTSNFLHNFNTEGDLMFRINVNLSETIQRAEEAFSRIFSEIEFLAVPVYYNMILANIAFHQNDRSACAHYLNNVSNHLRPLMKVYYDRMHDGVIAHAAWLSHVQGFYGWGAGFSTEDVDAFLGLPPYLTPETQAMGVPARQRKLAEAFGKHSFRHKISSQGGQEVDKEIISGFDAILKHLRIGTQTTISGLSDTSCTGEATNDSW
ncbi:hypothetical protein HJFPF1_10329 [Paramyrothecium foliicola]|nr:hypothetical protein HJFPF1_10329 [Paramyrothecium foliicola]